jgi:hypothetical protein
MPLIRTRHLQEHAETRPVHEACWFPTGIFGGVLSSKRSKQILCSIVTQDCSGWSLLGSRPVPQQAGPGQSQRPETRLYLTGARKVTRFFIPATTGTFSPFSAEGSHHGTSCGILKAFPWTDRNTIAFKLLQMMGDRLPRGISAWNRLWDEFQGFSRRLHLSTRDDPPPSKCNVFKDLIFTEPARGLSTPSHQLLE